MKTNAKDEIELKFDEIINWINAKQKSLPQILYSSVDVRESDFKIASIDTNIFPAGFNNICQCDSKIITNELSIYLEKYHKNTSSILLLCENHTRNAFYLENIYQLSKILKSSGCNTTICTFLNEDPTVNNESGKIVLDTAMGHSITIYCLDYIIKNKDTYKFDICLLNNDLTDGNLNRLNELKIPIAPHPNLGWHKRQKSNHFKHLNGLVNELCKECNLNIDPWLLTTYFEQCSNISINNQEDREKLSKAAEILLEKIKQKYKTNKISDKPYLILKSDNGTYGMGIISIESADEIKQLNRKQRNKLSKGKSSVPINNIIIQEGIPTNKAYNEETSEEVIYNLNGTPIGGFYRIHNKKSNRDILNSKGMTFKTFCQSTNCKNEALCGIYKEISKISTVISKLANLSAQMELKTI